MGNKATHDTSTIAMTAEAANPITSFNAIYSSGGNCDMPGIDNATWTIATMSPQILGNIIGATTTRLHGDIVFSQEDSNQLGGLVPTQPDVIAIQRFKDNIQGVEDRVDEMNTRRRWLATIGGGLLFGAFSAAAILGLAHKADEGAGKSSTIPAAQSDQLVEYFSLGSIVPVASLAGLAAGYGVAERRKYRFANKKAAGLITRSATGAT